MKPLVSIVIPTYNRAHDLERALKSVFEQTYSNWEVLIVDNHSSDYTDDLISGYQDSRIKLLKIHNNGVIAASRNLGINNSVGEYVALLDSDDWWVPQKLDESVKYLMNGVDVVYHDLFLVTKDKQKFFWRKTYTRDLRNPVFDDLIANGNTIANSSVVICRKILQKINGFSENPALIATEDFDGWIRVSKVTGKFKKIHKTLGYYWMGGGNTSSPKRTLEILDAFESRYATEIANLELRYNISWLHYAKGKAYYCLGSYEKTKNHLNKALFSQINFRFKIKCLLMLLSGGLRAFIRSFFR